MTNVTADQVREAVLKARITFVPSHPCSICGHVVGYVIEDGDLFYDSNCGCGSYESPLRPTHWAEAADYINCQPTAEIRCKVAKSFGLELAE